MQPHPQLNKFLSPYSQEIQDLTLQLRHYLTQLIPECNELIWDNYNALAMAYSKSQVLKDAFCHIAVYSKHVNLGFNRGAELINPDSVKLNGGGKLIRHIKVTTIDQVQTKEIASLIYEAVGISESRNAALISKETAGKSIVMSVSPNKRRP